MAILAGKRTGPLWPLATVRRECRILRRILTAQPARVVLALTARTRCVRVLLETTALGFRACMLVPRYLGRTPYVAAAPRNLWLAWSVQRNLLEVARNLWQVGVVPRNLLKVARNPLGVLVG